MDVGRYLDLGVRMFLFMALFTFAGYGLDRWFSSKPLWLVVGASMGAVAGMTHVVYAVLKESSGDSKGAGGSKGGDPGDEGS